MLNYIISNNTINKLLQFEAYDPSGAYTVSELFSDLKKGIWSELQTHQSIDIYRRNLQKIYAQKLIDFIQPADKTASPSSPSPRMQISTDADANPFNDGLSIVKGQIKDLIAEIRRALPSIKDSNSRLHLEDVMDRLKVALDPKS